MEKSAKIMWIIAKFPNSIQYAIELSGEETISDLEDIFAESYGYRELSFITKTDLLNNKSIPIRELLGNGDFYEIEATRSERTSNTDAPITQGYQSFKTLPPPTDRKASASSSASSTKSSLKPLNVKPTLSRPPPAAPDPVVPKRVSTTNPNDPPNFKQIVDAIIDMGFDITAVETSLRNNQYDQNRALDDLMQQGTAQRVAGPHAAIEGLPKRDKDAIARLIKQTNADEGLVYDTYMATNKDEVQTKKILSSK